MSQRWIGPLLRIFGTNWITLFGANLTTISAIVIFGFLILGLFGLVDSPYIALMTLLILPGVFVFGLVLIPLGIYWEKRKRRQAGVKEEPSSRFPVIDFNKEKVRRVTVSVIVLTLFNLFLISLVSYEGVAYMDSTEFCGQVCHTVMEPEFTAHQDSPHSRVECVECHIGPGAPWFVRSKLSGMGQVIAVTLHTYEEPIPTPVENLRPSQVICEQCHWPGKFTGDEVRVITRYQEDEANTPLKTVLLMHIGGVDRGEGIHSWHIDPGKQTSYIALDEQRQEIGYVRVADEGEVTEYFRDGIEPGSELLENDEMRTMDCVDCHNRPTHIYRLPNEAMDDAMSHGRIDPSIPFIKKVGAEILTDVGEALGASEQVVQRVRSHYRENYPDLYNQERAKIEAAVKEVEQIYSQNVFPEMKVTWGTYPNNIGHQNFPGCFRCHDGEHSSPDGEESIEQDCGACHTILAWDEENPAVLDELGLQ